VKETKLLGGIKLVAIETPLDGRITSGIGLIRFLPQGYATPTWIHLEDEEDNDYTLIVNPLLGTTRIVNERVEMARK
jgi:hypothetical protein